MKTYKVTGFTISGIWAQIEIKTIPTLITKRAEEKGLVEITEIMEEK